MRNVRNGLVALGVIALASAASAADQTRERKATRSAGPRVKVMLLAEGTTSTQEVIATQTAAPASRARVRVMILAEGDSANATKVVAAAPVSRARVRVHLLAEGSPTTSGLVGGSGRSRD